MAGYAKREIALDRAVMDRYLRVLRVPRRAPTLAALNELIVAQMAHVPFENISKLHRMRQSLVGVPDIETHLEGIERFHFGGTCYANNFHFFRLLASLGYDARLCAADMRSPDVHVVILITVDRSEYLVDVGYAAPFLKPLPRDLREDVAIVHGRDRYVLQPQDAAGRSRLTLYRNGIEAHSYVAKPAPRRIEEFASAIAESFRSSATFLNAVLLARFTPAGSVVIHNREMIDCTDSQWHVSNLATREEQVDAIEEHFGMPGEIIADTLSVGTFQDAWAAPSQ